ncbi:MAG TPA: sugar phosphate isomerase/epimerase family protein [Bacteroidales bacterium]|nr:sugar phosphate isomerase/epimerase family protein [Bacteroidales bacterium]
MNKLSRRKFLSTSAFGIGSAFMASKIPVDLISGLSTDMIPMPVGFQVWPVREKLVKDFPGTLKMMAALGYKSVEMCSPPGYEDSGFGPLMKLSAREMKQIINDSGLEFTSTHYGFDELKNHLDDRINFALDSGQKQMILSSFGLPRSATLDDWKRAADVLNEIGRKSGESGIQMGYHNHDMEFGTLGDTLIYDALMKQFDADLVKMQFQVAVIRMGYKASSYFEKYPGRFISAHLADMSPDKSKNVPVGQGIVDWKEFFATLKTGGVQNIFVEMDPSTFKDSIDYLNNFVS